MLLVLQASMWEQFNPDGTLTYGNFGNSNSNYANVLDESYWWNPLFNWNVYFGV
jgi:hypothetical protein